MIWPALLVGVFLGLAIFYAALVPPFEGADSGGHFGYIAYLRQQRALPTADAETAAFSHELILQPPFYYLLAAVMTPSSAIEPGLQLNRVNPYYRLGLSRRATYSSPGAPPTTLALWIARLVSIIGGALAVLGTWLLVRELLPHAPWAALAAASLVGFNPQFLFISASITNDAWPTGLTATAIWLAARCALRGRSSAWAWLGAGAVAGLAALTKYSGVVVALPFACFLLVYWRQARWRGTISAGLWALLGALLTGGFWYIRNQVLYGSPIPLASLLALLPGVTREHPASAAEIWAQMPVVEHSYWGIYGYGILAQPWFYQITGWIVIIGAVGLIAYFLWRWRSAEPGSMMAALIALIWFAASSVSAVNYMRIVNYADQGRLFFSAAPAVALLLVLGWQALCPGVLRTWLYRLIPLGFIILALSQVTILREGYRIPRAVDQPMHVDRPVNAEFSGGMELVGVDLPMGAGIDSGSGFPITLYFRARHEIADFYTLFMHLADDRSRLLWQFDGVPSVGRHPTRQWLPGEVFADTYFIHVEELSKDGLATLSLGFYQYQDPNLRQPVVSSERQDDRVVLAKVRLHATASQAETVTDRPLATWSNGIQLGAARIDRDSADIPRNIALRWQAQSPVHVDYTVSLQLLDAAGRLVAQVDKQPLSGEYPTSAWRAGDVINDDLLLPDPLPAWHSMIVLLYDASGRRLPLQVGSTTTGDFFQLATQ